MYEPNGDAECELRAERTGAARQDQYNKGFFGTASPARTGDPQIHNLVL